MSIQSEITRLATAKTDIAAAIVEKGVDVPSGTKMDGMASLITAIQADGGGVKFATGTFTIGDADVATIEVEHNLGVIPNFTFYMWGDISKSSTTGLVFSLMSQLADGSGYQYNAPIGRYAVSRTHSATSSAATFSHNYATNSSFNAFYGVTSLTEETAVFGYNDTYPLKAGRTYNWICAVIATTGG